MKPRELLSRIANGRMTRRQALSALSAAGIGTVTMSMRPRLARAAEQATYFTWSGYDVPEMFPNYVQKHGAMPNAPIFADEEEAFQKLRAGFSVDVAHPCSGRINRWRDAGILQPIDTGKLSNWGDLFPYLKSVNGADEGGQQWFVPVEWGNTSVIYRTDLVEAGEDSWSILWDERYKGRLSIGKDVTDTAVIVGLLVGVKDPYDPTDDEIAMIKAKLDEQRPLLRFYWEDDVSMQQAMASGEIVASSAWNSAVVKLKEQGVPVAYMKPKEGMLSWCCGLILTKDAKEIDLAHELIDAIIDPSAGLWIITDNGYGHSNKKSFDRADQAVLDALGLPRDPSQLLESGVFSRENKQLDKLQQMFEAVQAG